ncbi:MAG: ATP-binding protein [Chloroflexota bacterium]|nr:ATP-binding protein [Chloroflexota bacterium]
MYFNQIMNRLTEPHPSIEGEDQRYIARLIASVLLATLSVIALYLTIPFMIDSARVQDDILIVALIELVVTTIAYGLSRTRYYHAGAAVLIFSSMVLVYSVSLINPSDATFAYRFLVFSVLISGILMPFRFTLRLMVGNLIAGLIASLFIPHTYQLDFAYAFLFICVMSILQLVFMRNRDALENKRRTTITANAAAYRKLAEQHAATNRHLQGVLSNLDGVFVTLDTEMRTAAHALTEAREATIKSLRQRTEFVSNVSHEIRTPMTGVIGMLELLRETEMDDLQRELVAIGSDSAGKLLHILDDILDFSKLESGRLELESRAVDVRALCAEIKAMLLPQRSRANLDFRLQIDDDVPAVVYSDPLRLRQVLINLAGNAVKFTHEGSVELRVKMIECGADDVRLRFEISDTGIGIAADQIERIFESFVQGDSSTTRRYGGTGLGLAIARQLIRMMDGEINVESRLGEGSIFAFELKLPTQAQNSHAPRPELRLKPSEDRLQFALTPRSPSSALPRRQDDDHRRILLVEDNPINRQFMAGVLTTLDVMVDEAENGETALTFCAQRQYDLILMDVHMPLMDGLETTQHIRASDQPNAATPILAVTASVMPDERNRYLAAGMNGVLSKPFTMDQLRAAVNHWLHIEQQSEALS